MLDDLNERLAHRQIPNRKYPNLEGKRILVVEDDPVIAVDYHFQMKDAGAKAQGFKGTNASALLYLDTHDVDAAIIDFQLSDGTSEAIIDCLKRRGIPYIVVSACTFRIHDDEAGAPILAKPVMPGEVCRALSEVLH